jgi:hypothetical protein
MILAVVITNAGKTGRKDAFGRTAYLFSILYILIGEGFSFQLHNLLIFGRILTFEVSN